MDNPKFCDDNHHEPWALELNEFFEKNYKNSARKPIVFVRRIIGCSS